MRKILTIKRGAAFAINKGDGIKLLPGLVTKYYGNVSSIFHERFSTRRLSEKGFLRGAPGRYGPNWLPEKNDGEGNPFNKILKLISDEIKKLNEYNEKYGTKHALWIIQTEDKRWNLKIVAGENNYGDLKPFKEK